MVHWHWWKGTQSLARLPLPIIKYHYDEMSLQH